MIPQNQTDSTPRFAKAGLYGVYIVIGGSIAANTYTAVGRVSAAYGGWDRFDLAGGLNALLAASIAIGAEITGFLALGFAFQFAKSAIESRNPSHAAAAALSALAAAVVFWQALGINVRNTEDFVLGTAEKAAQQRVLSSKEYEELQRDASKPLPAEPSMSPAAIQATITGLESDLARAQRAGLWAERRAIAEQIKDYRGRLTASMSKQIAYDDAKAKRETAQREIDLMLTKARPSAADRTLADLTKTAVEVIKALGVIAFLGVTFSQAAAPVQAPAPSPQQSPKAADAVAKVEAMTPAPSPKASPKANPKGDNVIKINRRAAAPLSLEERRARQAGYAKKHRDLKKAAAAG